MVAHLLCGALWRSTSTLLFVHVTLAVLAATVRSASGAECLLSSTAVTSVASVASASGAFSVALADLDNDGAIDLLASTTSGAPRTFWLRNRADGSGAFSDKLTVSTGFGQRVIAADLNGDGVADAVVSTGSSLGWFRNNGTGGFPSGFLVVNSTTDIARIAAADLDGDGAQDVLFAGRTTGVVAWNRNNGTGGFAAHALVLTSTATLPTWVAAADLDDDGSLDVLFAGQSVVAWFRNTGTGPSSTALRVIDAQVSGVVAAVAADLDGDNALDVVTADTATVGWYRSDAAAASGFESERAVISDRADQTLFLVATDINNDNAVDLLFTSASRIGVFLMRNGGAGRFAAPELQLDPHSWVASVDVGDVNGDGLKDVALAVFAVSQFRLVLGNANVSVANVGTLVLASLPSFEPATAVAAADLDRDGAQDVLLLSETGGTLMWFRNDQQGGLSGKPTLLLTASLPMSFAVADLDGDGALDILVALSDANTFGVLANDGTGVFASELRAITTSAPSAFRVLAADLNGDFYVDALCGSTGDNTIGWFANNGSGAFTSARQVITAAATGMSALIAADVDGNGALDAVAALLQSIVWYANNGAGVFSAAATVAGVSPAPIAVRSLAVADFDRDGNLDVLASHSLVDIIGWYPNAGSGVFAAVASIIGTSARSYSVSAPDLDQDGWVDVLAALVLDGTFVWYRNNGGSFAAPNVIASSVPDPVTAIAVDVDGDGVLDVLCGAGDPQVLSWYKATTGPSWPLVRPALTASAAALPAECGGVVGSFACLTARVASVTSMCARVSVALPPTVRGCVRDPSPIRADASVRLLGVATRSRVECSAPGARSLFALNPRATLEMRDVDVVVLPSAASSSPSSSLLSACTAFACDATDVTGLVLHNVTVSGFVNAAPTTAFARDLDRGYGAVLVHARSRVVLTGGALTDNRCESVGAAVALLGAGASLSAFGTVFARNTAAGSASGALGLAGGGAIALVGAGQTAALTDCTLASNAALAGSGGALLVGAASVALTLTRAQLRNNTAAVAGGALALVAAPDAAVTLRTATLTLNSAAYGGSIAALSGELAAVNALQAHAMALTPPGGVLSGGRVTLDSSSWIGASTARYGGAFFACAALINASLAVLGGPVSASGAGGVGFRCNVATGLAASVGDSWLALPTDSLSATASQSAPAYGPLVATPPLGAQWLVRPPASSQSGVPWRTGSFVLTDSLGQRVSIAGLALRLALASSPPSVVIAGSTALLLPAATDASFSLASAAPSADGWPASLAAPDGLPLSFVLAIDAGGVASTTPGSPTLAFTLALTNCAAGWGRVSADEANVPLVCGTCTGGTFSTAERAAAAERCEICPANTIQLAAVSSGPSGNNISSSAQANDCVCKDGTYAPNGRANAACFDCPPGASCAGGSALPVNLDGFWQIGNASFAACPIAGACLADSRCAAGYTGALCKDCQRNHFANARGECVACPRGAAGALAAFVFAIVAAALASFVIVCLALRKAANKPSDVGLDGGAVRARLVPPSLSMSVQALQIVTVFAVAPFSWPSDAQRALSGFAVFSLDINLFASECTLHTFATKYLVSMLAPVGFVLVLVVVALGARLAVLGGARIPHVPLGALVLSSLFTIGPLVYLPLARATLVLFDCRTLPGPAFRGQLWLKASLVEQCFSGSWWSLVPVGLAGLAAYVIGIPLAIVLTLMRHREALFSSASVFRRFGSLYQLMRRPYFFLPVVLMGKKLAIAASSLFLSLVPSLLIAVLLVVIGAAGLLQSKQRPYYFALYERLDLAHTCLLSAILVCGMVLSAESGGTATVPTTATARAIAVLVIVIVAALVLVSLVFVLMDIREIRDERSRRTASAGLTPAPDFDSRASAQVRALLLDVENTGGFLAALRADARGARAAVETADEACAFDFGASQVELADFEMAGPAAFVPPPPVEAPGSAPAPATCNTSPVPVPARAAARPSRWSGTRSRTDVYPV